MKCRENKTKLDIVCPSRSLQSSNSEVLLHSVDIDTVLLLLARTLLLALTIYAGPGHPPASLAGPSRTEPLLTVGGKRRWSPWTENEEAESERLRTNSFEKTFSDDLDTQKLLSHFTYH